MFLLAAEQVLLQLPPVLIPERRGSMAAGGRGLCRSLVGTGGEGR